jgi:hypothetical protein
LNVPDTTSFTNLNVSDNRKNKGYGNFYGGAGIQIRGGAPRLENITVKGNTLLPYTDQNAGHSYPGMGGGGIAFRESTTAQVKNALVSNNKATDAIGGGGGINIWESSPRLENIIVTGNETQGMGGGGIRINGDPTIVNAIISGNSAVNPTYTTEKGYKEYGGGGILVYGGSPVIVNALVSGNSSLQTTVERNGGGGINVVAAEPTFINVTVSGNYSSTRGGGIILPLDTTSVNTKGWFYNTLVLGNYSENTDYADDDVWIGAGTNTSNLLSFDDGGYRSFVFNNSLLGGRAVTSGVHDDYPLGGTHVTPGGGNESGVALGGYQSDGDVDSLASTLDGGFFVKFAARPTANNTGASYVPADWDFDLSGNAAMVGAVNTGDATYYDLVNGGLVKNAANNDSDVEGNDRIQKGIPDMGAYESGYSYAGVSQ